MDYLLLILIGGFIGVVVGLIINRYPKNVYINGIMGFVVGFAVALIISYLNLRIAVWTARIFTIFVVALSIAATLWLARHNKKKQKKEEPTRKNRRR